MLNHNMKCLREYVMFPNSGALWVVWGFDLTGGIQRTKVP